MSKPKTRDKLLDAGYEEIYKHGFQGASIDAILKACSVPKGSMYYHFKSKKELALAVIDERLSPKMHKMLSMPCESDLIIDKLFFVIDFIGSVPYLLESGCPLSKLIAEMVPLDKEFEAHLIPIRQSLYTILKELIEKGMANKEIQTVDSESLTTFVVASIWGNIAMGKGLVTQGSYQESTQHLKNYLNSLKL